MTSKGFQPTNTREHLTNTGEPFNVPLQAKSSFTPKELAEMFGVTDATIRTKWMNWLVQVAPESRLKLPGGSYTVLAKQLFSEVAPLTAGDRRRWVQDNIPRYKHLWADVIEAVEHPKEPDVQGGAIVVSTEIVDVAPFDMGEPVRVNRLNLERISNQTQQINTVIEDLKEQAIAAVVEQFEMLGDHAVELGKNAFARRVATGLRDTVSPKQ